MITWALLTWGGPLLSAELARIYALINCMPLGQARKKKRGKKAQMVMMKSKIEGKKKRPYDL